MPKREPQLGALLLGSPVQLATCMHGAMLRLLDRHLRLICTVAHARHDLKLWAHPLDINNVQRTAEIACFQVSCFLLAFADYSCAHGVRAGHDLQHLPLACECGTAGPVADDMVGAGTRLSYLGQGL